MTLYFKGTVVGHEGEWGQLGNWYEEGDGPASLLPASGDDLIFLANLTVMGSARTCKTAVFGVEDGSGSHFRDHTYPLTCTDGATFWNLSMIWGLGGTGGTIVGDTYFASEAMNYDGVVDGNATFHWAMNGGTVTGNALFEGTGDGTARNISGAIVEGDATFIDGASNGGHVNGHATFDGYSADNNHVVGSATFLNGAINGYNGTVTGDALFDSGDPANNGIVSGYSTFINGATNAEGACNGGALFTSGSFNNGTVTGGAIFDGAMGNGRDVDDAVFKGGSYNGGHVTGDAVFNDSSYHSGGEGGGSVTGTATFTTLRAYVLSGGVIDDYNEGQLELVALDLFGAGLI